jgi:hypothetical protein
MTHEEIAQMQFTDEQQHYIDERYELLPVDADGVPIRVGDVLYEVVDELFKVDEMLINKTSGWDIFGSGYGKGFSSYDSATCHHYYKPTVEDVLREYASIVIGVGDRPELDGVLSECAGRIRELMADE